MGEMIGRVYHHEMIGRNEGVSPLEGKGVRFSALALGSKHVGGETSGSETARCRWNRGAVLYERYPIIPTKIFPKMLVVFFCQFLDGGIIRTI